MRNQINVHPTSGGNAHRQIRRDGLANDEQSAHLDLARLKLDGRRCSPKKFIGERRETVSSGRRQQAGLAHPATIRPGARRLTA
ncbi:MAG: hypothetical protein ACKOYJ_06560 [Planctomycetia bacterium]